ncbi:DNA polymerase III subunit epsilon [Buchnera aphidicola (Formosaphis micheliae)]|uniref:DNA polymerase III subunit epsilon n=1 Tax=Buchnera aphidicola TaxID=9 RepID=UPI0031CCCFC3
MKLNVTRQIVLDTETTGINNNGIFYKNHRIIEIGAVEIINRHITGNNFHTYIQPDRSIDDQAFAIHGISQDFLKNKPRFSDISEKFISYLNNSELIIHNAHFDISFITYEFNLLNINVKNIVSLYKVIDTLELARKLFPGKKNTLDALSIRYNIIKNNRPVHSALLDAKLLAKIYFYMTSFQESINFESYDEQKNSNMSIVKNNKFQKNSLYIRLATVDEVKCHEKYLQYMTLNNNKCLWKKYEM